MHCFKRIAEFKAHFTLPASHCLRVLVCWSDACRPRPSLQHLHLHEHDHSLRPVGLQRTGSVRDPEMHPHK